MAIQNRRGVYSDFTPSKMVPGELAVVQSGDPNNTSGKAVYAAFGASGDVKRLASEDDLSGKVDKVTGKGLSTNDYTTAEKNKLSGIEAQANKTVIDSTLTQTGQAADAKAVGDAIDSVTIETDKTLTEEDVPADAKVVGDELADVKSDLAQVFTDEMKDALLACFEYTAWSEGDGQELRDNLYNALYGGGSMAIGTFTYLKNQVKALAGTINSVTVSDVVELRVKTDQTNRLVIGMTDGDHKLKNTSGSAVDLYLIPVPSGANFVKVTTEGGYEGNPVDFYVCTMAYNSTVNDYEKVYWGPQSVSGTKIDITDKAGDGLVVGVRLNTEVYPNPLDPNVISAKIEFFAS